MLVKMRLNSARISVCNIAIVIAYVVSAYLGLLLALPPGYATAVWAPSGIALGAVLIWGLRCLPGVFIGSFLINFYITHLNGGDLSHPSTWLVASLIALGAVLQAWLGCWLIKKVISLHNTLVYPKEILIFAFLSGPISCLVNATWSNASLFILGLLPLQNIPLSWMTWWVGDSIGVLIFTPMLLILFAEPRKIWRTKFLQIFLPLLLSFVVVVSVYLIVSMAELKRVGYEFHQITDHKKQQLDDWFLASTNLTRSMSAFLSVEKNINATNFHNFAKHIVTKSTMVQAVEWVPKVKISAEFTEKNKIKTKSLAIGTKSKRENYALPILYAYPARGNEKAIGFDLSTDQLRFKGIQTAMQMNDVVLSEPIKLTQSQEKDVGAFLFMPVKRKGVYAGFAVVVLNLSKEFQQLFPQLNNYADIAIYDKGLGNTALKLYEFSNPSALAANKKYQLQYYSEFPMGNGQQTLKFVATASVGFIAHEYSWQVWTVLVGGLLFCVLMAIILFILHGQKYIIQSKVEKQTSKLRAEESKNLLLLQAAGEGIFGLDMHGDITFINPAACDLLGYQEKDLLGKNVTLFKSNTELANNGELKFPLLESLQEGKVHKVSEFQFSTKQGGDIWVEYISTPINTRAELSGAVVIFNDIGQERETKIRLEKMAHYDVLTGLPNRHSFLDYLAKALARAKRYDTVLAVCFLDLDNFKQINDNLGHNVGDELLKVIPKLLISEIRDVDYLARLSGDEFALILESVQSPSEINDVLLRYLQVFQQPIRINKYEVNTSASIGVALYPSAGKTSEELIKNADIAMYKAKELGKNTVAFFNEETNFQVKRLHQIETSLRKAVKENEFQLFYQPQLEAKTHRLYGVEALLRWDSGAHQPISPAEFIPIAEDCGLIHDIGHWVVRQIAADFDALITLDPKLKISINASPRQLEHATFVEQIKQLFEDKAVGPKQLTIEVTETAVMLNPTNMIEMMHQLHQMGVLFALDDFGTGYSSMNYLKQMPIEYIKIDQSFVGDLETDLADAAIVKAIIQLSNALGTSTIAEGVETEGQSKFLEKNGCSYLQGYWFAKPMSLSDLIEKYKGGS